MVYLHHNILALSVASILVSYVLARSIKDEIMQRELAEPEMLIDPAVSTGADARVQYRNVNYIPNNVELLTMLREIIQPGSGRSYEGSKRSSIPFERRDTVPALSKRKMFWSPLGHLPASARLGRPQAQGSKNEEVGSAVFRYG